MTREGTNTKLVQLRVDRHWLEQVNRTVEKLKTVNSGSLDRSTFIRDMIGVENVFWRRSPYICKKAHHVVLVTANGEFFYRRGEVLQLNNDVERIPGVLSMKTEKRDYFTEAYDRDQVRRVWRLNNFALWEGASTKGELLDSRSDPNGLSTKMVQLDCYQPEGAVVFRETCAVLDDYVQYLEPGTEQETDLYDRVDILVDIPTRQLEILVIVDRDLHQPTARLRGADFVPTLKFELRNREEVPFASTHSFQAVLRERFLRRIGSSYPAPSKSPDEFYKESVGRVKNSFHEMKRRMEVLVQRPETLGQEDVAERIKNVTLPERYLFYRILWSWAHIGLYLSVKWAKPEIRNHALRDPNLQT